MYKARERYSKLATERSQFLDTAVECSELTLPYLVQQDTNSKLGKHSLLQPWQSVGAKAVVTLSSKLMLAMLPPHTSFFKLQVIDDKLGADLDTAVELLKKTEKILISELTRKYMGTNYKNSSELNAYIYSDDRFKEFTKEYGESLKKRNRAKVRYETFKTFREDLRTKVVNERELAKHL